MLHLNHHHASRRDDNHIDLVWLPRDAMHKIVRTKARPSTNSALKCLSTARRANSSLAFANASQGEECSTRMAKIYYSPPLADAVQCDRPFWLGYLM